MQHLLHSIKQPIVCALCADEQEAGKTDAASLRDYGRLEAGFSDRGVQIWCRRHEVNVCHVDFDGQMLEADFRALHKKQNG